MESKAKTARNISDVLVTSNPGKSIAQMSREIGVNPLTLRNTMNGKTTPAHGTLSAIANYCGVTVDGLLRGEVAPVEEPVAQKEPEERFFFDRDDLLVGFREGWREGYRRGFADARQAEVGFIQPTESATTLN